MTLVKIAYASNTGNTEGISEHLEEAFEALEMEVVREIADDIDEDFFEDADIAVVATFTDGDGELPTDFEEFYEDIEEVDLSGKVFGVVGSGDSELYADYFCEAANMFEQMLVKTGAKKGAETLKIENDADDDDIEAIKAFAKQLVEATN
ncbi:flavodoxin [Vagococcus zengguangii]|uniref:Flavodoxin n=1 Tax=Vagococcus zengguangii TaxID=2571750 RepID=A0A4D7CU41_9ENTE|nr:flavodoxin [Vagococcus zengguangii]QCI85840.1 flavodoxin [Vagococcus zengguangii]TLG81781.1 flavodoxin [Vagococcus zengguangii]